MTKEEFLKDYLLKLLKEFHPEISNIEKEKDGYNVYMYLCAVDEDIDEHETFITLNINSEIIDFSDENYFIKNESKILRCVIKALLFTLEMPE